MYKKQFYTKCSNCKDRNIELKLLSIQFEYFFKQYHSQNVNQKGVMINNFQLFEEYDIQIQTRTKKLIDDEPELSQNKYRGNLK